MMRVVNGNNAMLNVIGLSIVMLTVEAPQEASVGEDAFVCDWHLVWNALSSRYWT